MKSLIVLLCACALFFTSCTDYRYLKRERKQLKQWVSHAYRSCESTFADIPTTVVNDTFAYFESDSVRFYLSPGFLLGFSTYDKAESVQQFKDALITYGPLFSEGMVTGKLFKGVYNSWTSGWVIVKPNGETEEPTLFGYAGKAVKILHIKPYNTHSTKIRGFEIWATTNKMESGWGSFPVFYLEILNSNGHKKQTLSEFITGAEKSCFSYLYTQI